MSELRSVAAGTAGAPSLLDHLLQISSRTFALNIPMLHEPARRQVTVAYLLFRVADSLEDSTLWPASRKLAGLEKLARLLESPSARRADSLREEWALDPPLRHPGYLELLRELPAVMRAAESLSPAAWEIISAHTCRTCRAMSESVAREREGILRLTDLGDLRAYCYAVAGIVGEMLTELFLLNSDSLRSLASTLRGEAAIFGEALQLVNILKDRGADAGEGRCYLPAGLDLALVFRLARADLKTAAGYCARIEATGSDRGIVAFTALPVLLARATLDRVEREGPGAKVGRETVGRLLTRLQSALERGEVGALLDETERESLAGRGDETTAVP
jgi:farnesyl-diphosphate farnesyltransferase